ncbi:hypothetical protein COO60DRAFT_830196 [Scenedesmus sp. NREL 46B-D3]|nr:hypothetical protein COO60DRAFT_830196 [Scenedesmus sp. NREL 46B-D3]
MKTAYSLFLAISGIIYACCIALAPIGASSYWSFQAALCIDECQQPLELLPRGFPETSQSLYFLTSNILQLKLRKCMIT